MKECKNCLELIMKKTTCHTKGDNLHRAIDKILKYIKDVPVPIEDAMALKKAMTDWEGL
jgi:hypothetical protein